MPFDRDLILLPDTDEAYEKKLIAQEKAITARMYKRYGDKGFVLNNLSTYRAFRVVKGVAHIVSVGLAFAFVFDLLVRVFTPYSLQEMMSSQAIDQHQGLMGGGLLLFSLALYGSIEYLKSKGIQVVFAGYYKPKVHGSNYRWGWILLTSWMLTFSILASYQGGTITPGLFDTDVDQTHLVDLETETATYSEQIRILIAQREELTSGVLGYRYGWVSPETQHFTLNSRGQRKLDQIDVELQRLRNRVLDLAESGASQNARTVAGHAHQVNRNGLYLAMISLVMEILIIISGAWLVWYGVKVEGLLTSRASKREYALPLPESSACKNPSGNHSGSITRQHVNGTGGHSKDSRACNRIVQKVYQKLKAKGVKPTWRKILAALPPEEKTFFNAYRVRRCLTEIRKEEKLNVV